MVGWTDERIEEKACLHDSSREFMAHPADGKEKRGDLRVLRSTGGRGR